MPTSALGIRAVDDLTLEVETEGVFPPLPGVMKFAFLLSKKALEAHGPYYNNDPDTKKKNQLDWISLRSKGEAFLVRERVKWNGEIC